MRVWSTFSIHFSQLNQVKKTFDFSLTLLKVTQFQKWSTFDAFNHLIASCWQLFFFYKKEGHLLSSKYFFSVIVPPLLILCVFCRYHILRSLQKNPPFTRKSESHLNSLWLVERLWEILKWFISYIYSLYGWMPIYVPCTTRPSPLSYINHHIPSCDCFDLSCPPFSIKWNVSSTYT